MPNTMFKLITTTVVMIAALPFLAPQTWGVTIDTSDLAGPTKLYQKGGASLGARAPLRVQCWQDGKEIIDQGGLSDMSLRPLLEQESVSFKRKGTKGVAVHIISVDETVCLVQAKP
jgi:hypothetical protein